MPWTVLSADQVAQLIQAACTPRHRILLMTLYATGARNADLAHLKVRGIAITVPGIAIALPAILIKLIGITPE